MAPPPTITLGYLTRKTSPSGATYLQGDLGNLRVTITAEPDLEPSATGDFVFRVVARQTTRSERQATRRSPLPAGDPFDLVPSPLSRGEPAPQGAPVHPSELIIGKLSKAERSAARAAEVIARLGALPPGGDELPDLSPSASAGFQGEVLDSIDCLHRPLV